MTTIRQEDFIQSVADALQFIRYYHPVDYIRALGARLRARGVAGGEGRDRADPDQLAHVRRGPPADLPGHRHRHRVPQDRHGRALGRRTMSLEDMVNEGVRRAYTDPDNTLRASMLADPAGKRARTPGTTRPAVIHVRARARRHGRRDRRGQGRRLGEQVEVRDAAIRRDSIVDWVLKTVPTMGAGWCPPGMLGIGIGGTRREGDAAGQGSADGADRHARAARRAGRRTASRSCASSSTRRSTRSASARRAWAA